MYSVPEAFALVLKPFEDTTEVKPWGPIFPMIFPKLLSRQEDLMDAFNRQLQVFYALLARQGFKDQFQTVEFHIGEEKLSTSVICERVGELCVVGSLRAMQGLFPNTTLLPSAISWDHELTTEGDWAEAEIFYSITPPLSKPSTSTTSLMLAPFSGGWGSKQPVLPPLSSSAIGNQTDFDFANNNKDSQGGPKGLGGSSIQPFNVRSSYYYIQNSEGGATAAAAAKRRSGKSRSTSKLWALSKFIGMAVVSAGSAVGLSYLLPPVAIARRAYQAWAACAFFALLAMRKSPPAAHAEDYRHRKQHTD